MEAWRATAKKEKEEGPQSTQMNAPASPDGPASRHSHRSGSDHNRLPEFRRQPVIGLQSTAIASTTPAYDDFYWMNHFGDPGYKYHTLMSQLWGVTARV